MLVLTRRNGQSLRIGGDVRVTVLSAAGNQVRLGIEAPPDVAIHREEVYERIAQANRDAAGLPDDALGDLVAHGRSRDEEGEEG